MRAALRFVTPADKSLSILCFPLSFSVAPSRGRSPPIFEKATTKRSPSLHPTPIPDSRGPRAIERAIAIAIAIRTTQVRRDASLRGNVVIRDGLRILRTDVRAEFSRCILRRRMGHAERVAATEQEEDPRGRRTPVTPRVCFDDGSPFTRYGCLRERRVRAAS